MDRDQPPEEPNSFIGTEPDVSTDEPGIVTAILLVIAIVLLIGVFLWTLDVLNPWVTDFIPGDTPDENGLEGGTLVVGILASASQISMRIEKQDRGVYRCNK